MCLPTPWHSRGHLCRARSVLDSGGDAYRRRIAKPPSIDALPSAGVNGGVQCELAELGMDRAISPYGTCARADHVAVDRTQRGDIP